MSRSLLGGSVWGSGAESADRNPTLAVVPEDSTSTTTVCSGSMGSGALALLLAWPGSSCDRWRLPLLGLASRCAPLDEDDCSPNR